MVYGDRVGETTTSAGGTGTLTLSGTAISAHRTFGASVTAAGANNLTDGGTTEILILEVDGNGTPTGVWEVCESVFTVTGNTVTRGTLLSSSTGSRINFATGAKYVYVVTSANKIISFAMLSTVQNFTASQSGEVTNLTSASASIAVDLALSNNFKHTLTENTTLAAPSNAIEGTSGIISFTQHASSPKTLAYNAFWKFPGGTIPTLTATNSALDSLAYYVLPGGAAALCSLNKGIA